MSCNISSLSWEECSGSDQCGRIQAVMDRTGGSDWFQLLLIGTDLDRGKRKGTVRTQAMGRCVDGAVQTEVLPAGTIPTTVLYAQVELGNNETGLPVDPILPTETRVNAEDDAHPTVNPPVAEETPPVRVAAQTTGVCPRQVAEVVEIDPPARPVPRMDYLKVLEHISMLGTKHFAESVGPMEADEWRSRLRTNGTIERFADFEVEFNHKYFSAEAWDRLESKFLDLVQGGMTVCEYEEEFNRLRSYVGKELEDEAVQVRSFIRGFRAELRTYCSVRTFHTVSDLVERMAMLETNLAEEAKQKVKSVVVSMAQSNDKKRKMDSAEEGKTSSGRSECPKCGRYHSCECWKAIGACTRCGKMDHSANDCPSPASDSRTCHHCAQNGHYRRDCPKIQRGQSKGHAEASKLVQNRGQTSAPRVTPPNSSRHRSNPRPTIKQEHDRQLTFYQGSEVLHDGLEAFQPVHKECNS
ncbi:hypothetical protein N665_2392s0001 [Sinapis alba]|nr:hypothetical protein N665_2392s0001 [Sinapis alba]